MTRSAWLEDELLVRLMRRGEWQFRRMGVSRQSGLAAVRGRFLVATECRPRTTGASTTERYARGVGERRQRISDQRLCGSNASQFWTTTIDGAFKELTTGITNRWPSADTSKPRNE